MIGIIGRTPVVGMYKVNGDVRTVCGYETGLDMTTVTLCPSTRMNRKDSEGARASPVRPNNGCCVPGAYMYLCWSKTANEHIVTMHASWYAGVIPTDDSG